MLGSKSLEKSSGNPPMDLHFRQEIFGKFLEEVSGLDPGSIGRDAVSSQLFFPNGFFNIRKPENSFYPQIKEVQKN